MNGKYQQPDSLGDAINTAAPETDPFIAADESYLLFTSQYRQDGLTGPGADSAYPRKDIYISFRKAGKWQPAKRLDAPVNTAAGESNPFVTSDGKTLLFTSERNFVSIPMQPALSYSTLQKKLHGTQNGLGDIYRVSAAVLEKYK